MWIYVVIGVFVIILVYAVILFNSFSSVDAYYSIYDKTIGQYNNLPAEAGDYEIYALKYDISDKHLEIHKFKYSYK